MRAQVANRDAQLEHARSERETPSRSPTSEDQAAYLAALGALFLDEIIETD